MQPEPRDETPPQTPHQRGRVGLWTVLGVFVAFGLVVLAGLSITQRSLIAPDWLRAEVESRLNAGLVEGSLRLGQIELAVSREGRSELLVRDVIISDPTGAKLADLNLLRTALRPGALFRGQIVPQSVALRGAQVTIRRDAEGRFTLSYGGGVARRAMNLSAIIDELEATLDAPALAGLSRIEADGLTLTLEDARTGRLWQATNAELVLERGEDGLRISVDSELFNGTDDLAQVRLTAESRFGTSEATLGASVTGVRAADVAAQAPALSYLGVLNAPISGSLRTNLAADGAVANFAAALDIGAGALQPQADAPAVPFDAGRAYFTFDPDEQRIEFSDLSVQSDVLALSGGGQAWLGAFDGNWPQTLTAQIVLREARIDPDGVFERPISIDGGSADLRVRLDPFSVELGRMSAGIEGARFVVAATAGLVGQGWDVAVDASVDEIDGSSALSLWPRSLVPLTRDWLDRNISGGRISDIKAALRISDGAPPIAGLSFDFADASVRYLPQMAPLVAASGRASLHDHRFVIAIDQGRVSGPLGPVDLAGSTFEVPDIRDTPSTIALDLAPKGDLSAALAVLSADPIALMRGARLEPSDFSGSVDVRARLAFETGRDLALEDLGLTVAGDLVDVRSESLVPGRSVSADRLGIAVDAAGVTLSGAVVMDGLPATVSWTRGIGKEAPPGNGRIDGVAEVTPAALETFGLDAVADSVSGATAVALEIELPEEGPPVARLSSNLAGLGLAIPAIGWSKPDPVAGDFGAVVRLGEVPEFESLSVSAPGLRADNIELALNDDRQFTRLRIPALRLGDWLDAPVSFLPRGEGLAPAVVVEGGAIDIRALDIGGNRGGVGGGDKPPVRLAPDRVIVSEGIVLRNFTGELRGGNGAFRARLNGGTPINGQLIETDRGTAIRVFSEDAGGAIRDAGFLRNGDGGTLDILLVPSGRPDTFNGELLIEDVTVRDAPALAALLDAISIVGLLDDGGTGIRFETVDAQFRLSPNGLQLVRSAAVGASMGISMDGVYDLRSDRMDMQGVVSPLFALNGLGSLLTRRGEGLFGFSFRMTGDASAPRIAINPLSILTPGMFREIFRRPAPRVDGGAPGQ